MHPMGRFRLLWDRFMLGLLAYVCITAPYIACFDIEVPLGSGLGAWEAAVNAAFVLDIYLNFRTGFHGELQVLSTRR
jgi:hypothetical protein